MKKKYHRSRSLLLFVLFHQTVADASVSANALHFMEPGDSVENNASGLRIFCRNAETKFILHYWKTVIMNLHTKSDTYELYDGRTPSEVIEKHSDNKRSWKFNWLGTKQSKRLRINPFEDTCIGVYTYPYNQFQYKIIMTEQILDLWKLWTMIFGVGIFWSARIMSRNALFYYICGITLGVTTSVVVLFWFISRLVLPRGKFMYVLAAAGSSMSLWLAQSLWENSQLILLHYRDWVLWYILITGFGSFVICYRFGPVTNTRTTKIIQWFLQTIGLVLLYYSSHFREASLLCCVIPVFVYNFPMVLLLRARGFWKKMFPARRRLLTDDEYRLEGKIETKKALSHLREFCSSPDCNQWKTVLRLKDPVRFAKFVEGETHLSDNESFEHDAELTQLIDECEYTDDEEDMIKDY